jgi:hypothetical protein
LTAALAFLAVALPGVLARRAASLLKKRRR